MGVTTRKRIVFRLAYKDIPFEELTGLQCNTQDEGEMQELAEAAMMADHRIQGYHIEEEK